MQRFKMDFSSLQQPRRPERVLAINYNIGGNMQPRSFVPTSVSAPQQASPGTTNNISLLINDGTGSSSHGHLVARPPVTSTGWIHSAFADVLKNGGTAGCSVCGGKK